MLKPKNLPDSSGSGADLLAGMMADYTRDMNVHTVALDDLTDAPKEWNFFKPLPDNKFYELIESIEENGLLVPLIVWEQPGGSYIILSGHNRKRAMQLLYNRTEDDRYRSAPCVVYRFETLSPQEARAILVDCNWVQRTLSTAEKARAIYTKYVELGRQRRGEGQGRRRYDDVAEHFGLKATQVYQYYKLAQLDDHWLDRVDAGEISIRAAAHLCNLTQEQRDILREIPTLTQKQILSVEGNFTQEETRRAAKAKDRAAEGMREVRILVPEDKYESIMKMIKRML